MAVMFHEEREVDQRFIVVRLQIHGAAETVFSLR
jgi:hypothetical protein